MVLGFGMALYILYASMLLIKCRESLMFVPMVAIFQCQDFHALQLDLHILWFDLTGLGYFVGVGFPMEILVEACKMWKECVSNLCTVTA